METNDDNKYGIWKKGNEIRKGQWTGVIETWKNGIDASWKSQIKTWGELGYQRGTGEQLWENDKLSRSIGDLW